ncbi:hypothetical protein EHI8A_002450 [Entamoeba histolytica HM-1:IMSS-B]|uniref:Uncharacterized protein n=4 Tax=Entamoeba histolytica TaxID=5759 RepID=C4M0Z5_ENTH1|nr:hypothetical protein EHI_135090 [Entamoeba histolytica HM-1:IMSS]EMH76446.1 hypothetical protein EHI8A_002450 [Entamoeba histolytica HM-1:IMSS-B]ENY61272.1 hypothetical protein EHI7A_017990 [Entamoeba histolytica HM-1:IMSS-A]BAN39965.1 hypothetical protein [Entamoeba histolytica]EAL46272.1 hypothetical protein EHI_135090 [Entamoeba histolytica HM-1:IMSS]GAT94853.1 hypothetical protein CL6EHI_135090 [Entamoeba histolytica]|eukprot:XP_651658.1 hypothetical protein EHI_135090 [Entamoeba histolytica HM-1:IMSS]
MTYGFPKTSFFIGLLLIGLLVLQTYLPHAPQIPSYEVTYASFKDKVNSTFCTANYPSTIQKVVTQLPKFNADILLIVLALSIILVWLFNLIPQNGFFSWTLIHLLTLLLTVIGAGALYLFCLTPSVTCNTFKTIVLNFEKYSNFEFITGNYNIIPSILSFVPSHIFDKFTIFKGIFINYVNKLGVTTPIFVVVIAFYLINKKTRLVTRFELSSFIILIISGISGIEYYKMTSDYIFTGVFVLGTIVLGIIFVNLLLTFYYILYASLYIFGCYLLSYRLLSLCLIFSVPFELEIACGFFIFLFSNIFIWTYDRSYLTAILLLINGLNKLYLLPYEASVIFVFLFYIFTCDCCCKCNKTCKKDAKQKTD